MEFFVYAHLNPATLKPFYIGKGKGNRHLHKKGRNFLWKRFVAKIGFIAIKLVDGLSDADACEIEKQYINRYGRISEGGILVNLAEGGKGGNTGAVWNKGKTGIYSSEYREKISRARSGQKLTEDAKPKILAALKRAAAESLKSRTHKVTCLISGKVWDGRQSCMLELNLSEHVYEQRIWRNRPIKGNHLQLIKSQDNG